MPTLMPFCSNKLCQMHSHMVRKTEYRARVILDNKEIELDRHLYENMAGNRFELCSICHEAINMLKK